MTIEFDKAFLDEALGRDGGPPASSLSGETYYGRLRPCQEVLVRFLEERVGDKPVILVDIGLGDGAPTFVRDLVEIVGNSHLQKVRLIGLENCSTRLEHAMKAIRPEFMPDNIEEITVRKADITLKSDHDLSVESVLGNCLGESKVDLLMSSNLFSGLRVDECKVAAKLHSVLEPNGQMAFGRGGVHLEGALVHGGLNFKVYQRQGQQILPPVEMRLEAMPYLKVVDDELKRMALVDELYKGVKRQISQIQDSSF